MTTRELLRRLAAEGLVDPALADPGSAEAGSVRRVLATTSGAALRVQQTGVSLSLWIGTALLTAFLVEAGIDDSPLFCLALGAGAVALGASLARTPPTLLIVQLLWISVIGGLSLLMIGVSAFDPSEAVGWTLALLAFAATIAAVPNLALDLVAVIAMAGALLGLYDALDIGPMGHGLTALAFGAATAWLWVHEAGAATGLRRLWQPLAYGLPLALFAPLLLLLVDPPGPAGQALLTAGFTGLSAWLIHRAGAEDPAIAGRPQALAWIALALAAIAGYRAPGLAAGILLLVLSHLRRSPALQAVALSSIGGFLFFWYYQLDSPLLTKSLAAVGNGLAFLLAAGLLRRAAGRGRETEARPLAARLGDLRWLAAALALALAIPGWQIAAKERVLAQGQTVLLRLRPVDPRSLMQGDFMRLAYALPDEVPNRDALPRRGDLIVTLDEAQVASFVRVDDGRPLAPGELRLDYTSDHGRISVGAESYFFPEGQAETFEAAAYGELAVAPDGESVLVGLRDAERRQLRPQ